MPKKKRAQGAGRVAANEPRIQSFTQFSGCNFNLSPRSFTLGQSSQDDQQTDMQMNFVTILNNISVTSNHTLESRADLIQLFTPSPHVKFLSACKLIGQELYIAGSDGEIYYENLGNKGTMSSKVLLDNKTNTGHDWQCFDYYDNQLIATTKQNQLWTGSINTHKISNAPHINAPTKLELSALSSKGDLKINATFTDECPFRTDIAYTYVNKFGPTETSDRLTFYSNHPVSEWGTHQYLRISANLPNTTQGIKAVELYYSADNASSLLFFGRVDIPENTSTWSYDWLGYLDATNMWTIANLIAPTQNYTQGAPASQVTNIDGKLYFWGDSNEPQRLYIGGNPGNLFSISPGTGGGFVDVEPGTGQEVRYVGKYKTQSGNSIVTLLCDSPNSTHEQRFNLVENNISLSNEQSMKSWQAEQVAGAVGCKSYHGALVCEDGLYSVSRYGIALTTMTMEYNSQIRANYISDPIKPIFTDTLNLGKLLRNATMLELDGILYIAFGSSHNDIDNVIFCYDINLGAWWTYTLDVDSPILSLVHIDSQEHPEGIGIVTPDAIYLLPTTSSLNHSEAVKHNIMIQTGELSVSQPQQQVQYLSQLEFHFDYFVGDITINLVGIDYFGRKVTVTKHIRHDQSIHGLIEYMRVDLRLMSYKLDIKGTANMRLTHWLARVYTISNRIGQVYGFTDSISYRKDGDIHPTFKSYNDIRQALNV